MKIRIITSIFLSVGVLLSQSAFAAKSSKYNDISSIPIIDDNDFEDAKRGFIGRSKSSDTPDHIISKKFEFLVGEAPTTVNSSLWRQAKLNNEYGLFQVSDSIYQVRGYDIANMSIIESKNGIIIIDPLTAATSARQALDLYYQYRPKKPVLAVIYSHSHADHFGGVKGVVNEEDVKSGKVKIIAPEGFMEEAISENIFAGNAMSRRATYMYGLNLNPGTTGLVDVGIGKIVSELLDIGLIEPNVVITSKNTKLTIDGIKMIFQLTPGTEAPSEMNIYFPQFKALNVAENSSKSLHNFYTLRGAKVRDSKAWAFYLDETVKMFGKEVDVMFAGHNWPTWGNERIVTQLGNQRDEILFIHNETLRLANMGYNPVEISEKIEMPKSLYKFGYNRGYYGSVKHNSRAVYQRYLGYYDGNPATLDPLPEKDSAKKHVEYMGGAEAVIKKAKQDFNKGEFRFVATALNYVVMSDPSNKEATTLLANTLEQLGFKAEASTWRNVYLSGALELRSGIDRTKVKKTTSPDVVGALSITQFFDTLALHLNPQKADGVKMIINWDFVDVKEQYTLILHNSVLRYETGLTKEADITIKIKKSNLQGLLAKTTTLEKVLQETEVTGNNGQKLKTFGGYFDKFDPSFKIVAR